MFSFSECVGCSSPIITKILLQVPNAPSHESFFINYFCFTVKASMTTGRVSRGLASSYTGTKQISKVCERAKEPRTISYSFLLATLVGRETPRSSRQGFFFVAPLFAYPTPPHPPRGCFSFLCVSIRRLGLFLRKLVWTNLFQSHPPMMLGAPK